MKIPPVLQILSVWLLVTIIGTALTLTRADAAVAPDPATSSVAAEPSAAEPEPTASREEATVPAASASTSATAADDDGPDVNPASTNQCGSGYFCVWTQANYLGTIQRFSTQSKYTSIVVYRVGSFYNNRSKRVMIYGDSSGSPSSCYGPGAKRNTTSGWLTYAEGTYLSTATSC